MICAVYKSPRKDEMYLYLPKRDDFSQVPAALMNAFGQPIFVLMMNLTEDRVLARENTAKVLANLREQGFHLQMPPPPENLLAEHRASLGLSTSASDD